MMPVNQEIKFSSYSSAFSIDVQWSDILRNQRSEEGLDGLEEN
jgi:hypothetical protein